MAETFWSGMVKQRTVSVSFVTKNWMLLRVLSTIDGPLLYQISMASQSADVFLVWTTIWPPATGPSGKALIVTLSTTP